MVVVAVGVGVVDDGVDDDVFDDDREARFHYRLQERTTVIVAEKRIERR